MSTSNIKRYIAEVIEDPNNPDELLLDLGPEVCDALGWQPGDVLNWQDQGNGTWVITRKKDDPAALP